MVLEFLGATQKLTVADSHGGATALVDGAQDQEIAERRGDAQAGGGRFGFLPACRDFGAGLPGAYHGRAARRLDHVHSRPPAPFHPAQGFHLLERLPHTDQAGPAARRIDDRIRKARTQLLEELVAHRFFSFDAIRLSQSRHIEVTRLLRPVAGFDAAVRDDPVDQHDDRTERPALGDDRGRRVFRHVHSNGQTGACAVGGQRSAGISC